MDIQHYVHLRDQLRAKIERASQEEFLPRKPYSSPSVVVKHGNYKFKLVLTDRKGVRSDMSITQLENGGSVFVAHTLPLDQTKHLFVQGMLELIIIGEDKVLSDPNIKKFAKMIANYKGNKFGKPKPKDEDLRDVNLTIHGLKNCLIGDEMARIPDDVREQFRRCIYVCPGSVGCDQSNHYLIERARKDCFKERVNHIIVRTMERFPDDWTYAVFHAQVKKGPLTNDEVAEGEFQFVEGYALSNVGKQRFNFYQSAPMNLSET
jgi:hypothetical protein